MDEYPVEYTLSDRTSAESHFLMVKFNNGEIQYSFALNNLESGIARSIQKEFSGSNYSCFPAAYPTFSVSDRNGYSFVPVQVDPTKSLQQLLKSQDFKEKFILRHFDGNIFKPSPLYVQMLRNIICAVSSLVDKKVQIDFFSSLDRVFFFDHDDSSPILLFSSFYKGSGITDWKQYGTCITLIIKNINHSFGREIEKHFNKLFDQIFGCLQVRGWDRNSTLYRNSIFMSLEEQLSIYYEVYELVTPPVDFTFKNLNDILRLSFSGWKTKIDRDEKLRSLFDEDDIAMLELQDMNYERGMDPLVRTLRNVLCHFYSHSQKANFPADIDRVEKVVAYFNKAWPEHLDSMIAFIKEERRRRKQSQK